MRIALAQLELSVSVGENLDAVKTIIARAAQGNADLVVSPEATMKVFNPGRLDIVAEFSSDRFVVEVSQTVHDTRISVVVDMLRSVDQMERSSKTMHHVFSSLLLVWRDEDGPSVEFYDKLHLFDAFGFRGSDTITPGSAHVVYDIPLADGPSVVLDLMTCFDIRFPEQFTQLANLSAEVIALPAPWNDGPDKVLQWQTPAPARTLDSTCTIAAADAARLGGAKTAGKDEGPTGMGYSILANADSGVVASVGHGPQLLMADADIAGVEWIHRSIPVSKARGQGQLGSEEEGRAEERRSQDISLCLYRFG